MGILEVKHGLLQVAETLDFLHNNAHLAHRSISPEVADFLCSQIRMAVSCNFHALISMLHHLIGSILHKVLLGEY
jgi:hypothetical protein